MDPKTAERLRAGLEPFNIIQDQVTVIRSNPSFEPLENVCLGLTIGSRVTGLRNCAP